MESRIYAIVGLPGSGKTTLGKKWSSDLKIPFLDDPKTADGNKRDEVVKLIKEGSHFIIADIFLCDPQQRARFEELVRNIDSGAHIFYSYFENRPDKCLANIKLRNDGRNVEPSLKRLSSIYTIPSTHLPMTIWTGDSNEAN